jgi:hypothetical protein
MASLDRWCPAGHQGPPTGRSCDASCAR